MKKLSTFTLRHSRGSHYAEQHGTVVEALPDGFVVEADGGQRYVAHLAGRLRKQEQQVDIGDEVVIGHLAEDPGRGRIVEVSLHAPRPEPAPGAPSVSRKDCVTAPEERKAHWIAED